MKAYSECLFDYAIHLLHSANTKDEKGVDRKRRSWSISRSPVFMRPENCASPDFPIPRFLRASQI